jgi:nucleoside-diphosphate-sugar epimerase
MRYFVTGATGFIGQEVVRQLISAGHSVNALVREEKRAEKINTRSVNLFIGDVANRDSMRAGMRGVDGIFHIAGWYKVGTRDQSGGERINILGTRNVLELMKEMNIPKGVYTSTLGIYSDTHGKLVDETYTFNGRHLSEYDRTKAAAHRIAFEMIKTGLPLVIVMPGVVYGPGDTSSFRRNLIEYLTGKLRMIPRRTAFTYAHVEDVAHGHILAMDKGKIGETYHICGEAATAESLFKVANQITDRPTPRTISPGVIKFSGKLMEFFEIFLPVPEVYSSENLRVIAGVTYIGSNKKAMRELGYSPRSMREGIRETLLHEIKLLNEKPPK